MDGKGFTVIECMVAFVMVSIFAMMAIEATPAIGDITVSTAARQIASDIRYARNLAISKRTTVDIVFNRDSQSYTIYVEDNSHFGIDPVTQKYMHDKQISVFGNVALLESYWIRFNKIGTPIQGEGTVVEIASRETNLIRQIHIIPNTGEVYLHENSTGDVSGNCPYEICAKSVYGMRYGY